MSPPLISLPAYASDFIAVLSAGSTGTRHLTWTGAFARQDARRAMITGTGEHASQIGHTGFRLAMTTGNITAGKCVVESL
jgi:hypothetical protein